MEDVDRRCGVAAGLQMITTATSCEGSNSAEGDLLIGVGHAMCTSPVASDSLSAASVRTT